MKILVLLGSPHKAGSSNMLAHEFITGARCSGHSVTVLDATKIRLNYCNGCNECRSGKGCVQQDDGAVIREEMLSSDMVVFVTPTYYFGMSAQLKTLVDRFHGYTAELRSRGMKAALITSLADREAETIYPLKMHFEKICGYLHFENVGELYGMGCATPAQTRASQYMREAFEFGRYL